METTLIRNARLVNEGATAEADVLIEGGLISRIGSSLKSIADTVIDARGLYLLPGVIDDQVHFREPGLTNKAEIFTESRAAAAGGITSFMEMPNTVPQTVTQELLAEKYAIGARRSAVNYSFFMGATNDNLDEVLRTDPRTVCGVKVFMGSSTGNMLVDDEKTLDGIFKNCPMLVATHCEKEEIVRKNLAEFKSKFGEDIHAESHPLIRSREACYASSSFAVGLAKKYGTRLHILHISTAEECDLFSREALEVKKITAEACVHHLWFTDADYAKLGNLIKWNPAVKAASDREAIWKALMDGRIDIVATDHAPHTQDEKAMPYLQAPSGGPLVQHCLPAMLECVKNGKLSLETLVEKMCHAPAKCFSVHKRGYLREGYFADMVLVDLNRPWTVSRENILYKCGWSPFEGTTFSASVVQTIVNGNTVYKEGSFDDTVRGERLMFDR